MLIPLVLSLLIAYLLGSIPFGVLLAKCLGLADPRTMGSGNIGATNMLRSGRKGVALATLCLDSGKGALAVILAYLFIENPSPAPFGGVPCEGLHCMATQQEGMAALALLSAALGHIFSPWLGWKGGKGIATILGGLWVLSWPVALFWCSLWLLVFLFTRYVSLASILAMALLPFAAWLRLAPSTAVVLAVASAFAIGKHRANILRLYQGIEPPMGRKKP